MKQNRFFFVLIIEPVIVAVLSDKNQELLQILVQKARQGEENAFGQIYDLYFEKVYRFVFYRVNHRETAEDLVAEAFIRVWKKLPEMKDSAAFTGWVFQIARNLVIDHYRARRETIDLELLENVIAYQDNILDHVNFGFDEKIFLQALRELGEEQQMVIKLKFLDELTNGEIAKIMEKTEGAIRVIQHRAIADLKKLLDNYAR